MKNEIIIILGHACQCLCIAYRSFTDLDREYSVFSLATPSAANDFLIFKQATGDLFELWARDRTTEVTWQDYKLNTWNSICSTWNSTTGVIQLWINGKPSNRKFISSGSNIRGPIVIVLGQVYNTTEIQLYNFI